MNQTVLEARVRGVNKAHDYANQLYSQLRAVFEPFVGQQIFKVDGTLLAKVKKLVDALNLPCTVSLHVYRHVSDYSLAYTVKTCEVVPTEPGNYGTAYYYEITVYVGEIKGKILTKINKAPNFNTKNRASDVVEARERYKEAKKLADEAHSALYLFGEYDR